MARQKNCAALRKIKPEKTQVRVKAKPDWGHMHAALAALQPESESYTAFPDLGKNGVIIGRRGIQIDDESGRQAVAQFKRPAGTPSYFEVFGKDKPERRSVGENILVLRAFMHLEGRPPIDERCAVYTFATLFGRCVLPRRDWPLFSKEQKTEAEAFVATWAAKLYGEVARRDKAKPQAVLPFWVQPDLAALYTPESIATEMRFERERMTPAISRGRI